MIRALIALFFLFNFNSTPKKSLLLPSSLKGYFTFPIAPGTTASLSGSFGDIRINHFHSGLDIRTGGREGKSVFAAAEGYVSRINVSRGGYGNALYITHPNGYTTLYAHLKEYTPKIKEYLNKKQYEQQKWEVDIELEQGEIPIKKAEMVAFSGNTGGSGGPHLHFEVRDAEENTLDPAEFDFFEIKDTVSPVIEVLSVVCKSKDALVNGKFGTFDFPVQRIANGRYKLSSALDIKGEVGFEIYTYDKSQTSPFRLGIKKLVAKKNGNLTYQYNLEKLSFYNKIDMNIHTNYERMLNDSKKFHKAYYEEGNSLGLYQIDAKNGIMAFSPGENSNVDFTIEDTFGNETVLNVQVKNSESSNASQPVVSSSTFKLYGTLLELISPANSEITIERNTGSTTEKFHYPMVFDLKTENIKGIAVNGKSMTLPYTNIVGPNYNLVQSPTYDINFGSSIYSKTPIEIENGLKLKIYEDIVPLKGRFDVSWKTNVPLDNTFYHVYIDGKKPKFVGGKWNNDGISFKSKEYGTFVVLNDTEEPVIRSKELTANNLRFQISDALSGIKDIECFVNGEWVMMEYEYKYGTIWSEKLENSKPFAGSVDLYVTDNAGNKAHFKGSI